MNTPLATTFSALSDPTRLAILAQLADGEATVNELAKPFKISLPAISRHLKVLESAGLISRSQSGQLRPCKLEPGALQGIDEWLEFYRRFWDQRFDSLSDYLEQLQKPNKENPK